MTGRTAIRGCRGATAALRLRERVNLSITPVELEELRDDWLVSRVAPELRGLGLTELAVAVRMGLDLGAGAAEDLEDLVVCDEALRGMPVGGYEALLDAFGDARRRGALPADVVRRWRAAFGGFLVHGAAGDVLHLPLGRGAWALCDGARLWRVAANPFA